MAVQLQLLGLPRLLVHDRTVAVSWPRRSLALLTFLFTSRGAVPRDSAAFALWPDEDEDAARANLRRHINMLRGVLPPEAAAWIVTDSGSIEFRHSAADTDVAAFEADASAAGPERLRRAVDAYGGDFGSPLDEAWVLTERERLRARFHALLGDLIGIEFSGRRFDRALSFARRIAVDEPLREDIARRIVAIRYAMGDRPGALTEFERFAHRLRTEMSIEPMPETYALRDLVLRGEPLPSAPDAGAFSRPAAASVARASPVLPFIGRRAALEKLRGAWASAAAGAGTAILVAGEAGIGKTRVVAEFLAAEVDSSARILRGTTASPEARPHEALLIALGQAAPFVTTLGLEPVWLSVLAPLVPEISARCPAFVAQPALPADREVTRLFEAFARFMAALARGRAVTLVLEDLHWSGPGTLAAIRYLAARLRGHRILLVVTFRADENPAVEQFARDLCTSRQAEALALSRLRPEETLELLASADPPIRGAEAAAVAGRSEGHPLFLTELLRDYPQTRDTVAGGIVELVGARLALCSPDAQTLARVASVCGSTFDLDVLKSVVGWEDGALVDRIAELLARQFIRSTAIDERGSYAFSHALVRAAVNGTVAAGEQCRIHRIVARELERRAAGARYDLEIARHWAAANEPQRAAEAYLRAAHDSLAIHARDEAAACAGLGLGLSADAGLRRACLKVRISANVRRVSAAELRADAAELKAICATLDDEARYDAALLAYRIEEVGGTIESRNAAAAALRAFLADEGADSLRAAQIAEADASNALMCGSLRTALEWASASERSFAASGSTRDELRAAMLVVTALTRLGDLPQALARLVELEPRIAALGDPGLAIDYWYQRTRAPHVQRDAAATLAAAKHLAGLAAAAGDRLMEGHAAVMTATALQHDSALSGARRELDRAEKIYRSIGAALALQVVRNNRASLLFQIGRIEESTALLRDLYAESAATGGVETQYFAASNLGCALLAAGDLEGAIRFGQEALDLARAIDTPVFAALALGDLGTAQIAAGRRIEGLAHVLEAASINRQLDRPAVQAHDLSRAAGAEPAAEGGAAHARSALAIVESDPEAIALAPEILARCAAAFERAGDAAAAAYCVLRGKQLLIERLAGLEGDDRAYYRALRWHAELLADRSASAGPGVAVASDRR